MKKPRQNIITQPFFLGPIKLPILMLLSLALISCGPSSDHSDQSKVSSHTTAVQTDSKTINPSHTNNSSPDTYTILAIGDSLTEGLGVKKNGNYPALLEQQLHTKGFTQVKVINSGLSGETSSGLKSRLDWALQVKPDLTILNIGANDAMRGVPLELTTRNINDIIQRIKATDSQVVLAGMQIYNNLGQKYVSGFKDMYTGLAQKHELTFIPFFLEHVAGDPNLNQADMIHPTTTGYSVIVERNVLPTILPLVEQSIAQ